VCVTSYYLSVVGLDKLTANDIFNGEYWRDLEMWVMGRSRSLNMAPIDRSYDVMTSL